MGKCLVSLNTSDEAFDLFQQLLVPLVVDVRGETVRFDIGDYVHLMDDEERVRRIRWIRETLSNPLEIRRSHLKSEPFGEKYTSILSMRTRMICKGDLLWLALREELVCWIFVQHLCQICDILKR